MKRVGLAAAAIAIVVLTGVLMYTLFLSEPVQPRTEYYCDGSNYITATGTVSHLVYSDNREAVYLAFEEIPEEFEDTSFIIEGENLRILLENGFAEKVQLGTEVEYMSAPRVFWDGYAMPIVAVSLNGELLLSFEVGKENLLCLIGK